MSDSSQQNIDAFKTDLGQLTALQVIRKRIIFGQCYAITDERYHNLRSAVADKFFIHPNDVVVVGSAKLGFSVAPHKRYQIFNDNSDIDLAIVSPTLFESIWKQVYLFEKDRGYWSQSADFKKYFFRGWIRPDKMPPSHYFDFCKQWWDFFQELTSSGEFGEYKIAGGLYHSWFFLENYQEKCINSCQKDLTGE